MLPADHRMRRSAEFALAFQGTRGSTRTLQVSLAQANAIQVTDPHPVRVGFVVSKKVGNSVVRHRLTRQLRHIMRRHLELFTPGECVVVRLFPSARGCTSQELEKDILKAVSSIRRKIAAEGGS